MKIRLPDVVTLYHDGPATACFKTPWGDVDNGEAVEFLVNDSSLK